MRAPVTFPDEPEPDPISRIIAANFSTTASVTATAQATTVPTGEEILANIQRVYDQLNRRTLIVNPADEDRIRAAALERGLILGKVQVSTTVPPGRAYVLTQQDPIVRWGDQ